MKCEASCRELRHTIYSYTCKPVSQRNELDLRIQRSIRTSCLRVEPLTLTHSKEGPRFLLNFCISGLVSVECTETSYYDNPDIQNSAEIGDLTALCIRVV